MIYFFKGLLDMNLTEINIVLWYCGKHQKKKHHKMPADILPNDCEDLI